MEYIPPKMPTRTRSVAMRAAHGVKIVCEISDAELGDLAQYAFNYAILVGRCVGLAPAVLDDFVQTCSQRVLTHRLRSYDPSYGIDKEKYVRGIVRSYLYELGRKQPIKIFSELPERESPSHARPLGVLIADEQRERLLRAVESLRPMQRVVITMTLAGTSVKEQAKSLGVSPAAIHSHRHRAYEELRTSLGDYFYREC